MGRSSGLRLIVTGQDIPWSPAVTPSWSDSYFASMGHVATSVTVQNPKTQHVWRTRSIPRSPTPPLPLRPDHPPLLSVQMPRFVQPPPVLEASPPVEETSPPVETPVQRVSSSQRESRCLWQPDLRATNAAYVTRGIPNMQRLPAEPTWRDIKDLVPETRSGLKPRKPAWVPKRSNVDEADGSIWMSTREIHMAVKSPVPPTGAAFPVPPHHVSKLNVKRAAAAGEDLVKPPIGVLERAPSLANYVGGGFSGPLARRIGYMPSV